MKELKIMDYCGTVVNTGIDLEDENISMITINVITGDEVATVYYKDGTIKKFDSSNDRFRYYDYSYHLYNSHTAKEKNEQILKKFLERNTSYSLKNFLYKNLKNA